MHPLIAEWRVWLAASGKPSTTIRLRTNQLLRFAEHQPDLVSATTADMLAWVGNPRWVASTRKSHRSALTSFYGWAHAFGHVAADQSRKLPAIRVPRRPARPALELVDAIIELLGRMPALKVSEIEAQLRTNGHSFQRGDVGKAARTAAEDGLLICEQGKRNALIYTLKPEVLPSAPECSPGDGSSTPDPSYIGREYLRTTEGPSTPGVDDDGKREEHHR